MRKPLLKYLKKSKTNIPAFAKKVGVGRPAVDKWLLGARRPRYATAQRIVEVTDGAVNLQDIYG